MLPSSEASISPPGAIENIETLSMQLFAPGLLIESSASPISKPPLTIGEIT